MLSKAFKARWLEALRSGQYKQANKKLRKWDQDTREYRYCCLGVACDIINPHNWNTDNSWSNGKDMPAAVAMPEATLLGIGLDEIEQSILIRMNDSGGRTFHQIADFIEGNL